jgi:RHS repeat-associated protein
MPLYITLISLWLIVVTPINENVSFTGFYGGIFFLIFLRGMKKRTVWGWIYGITALWFAVIMVYSNFIKIPPGRSAETGSNPSNLVHENVYFIHEDHMGRPVLLTQYEDTDGGGYDKDGNGNYYWKASYKPFGQVYDDFNSVGIKVGTGDTAITWTPSFRFPGQYADPELGDALFYNRFRFYMPSIGRYTSADPLGLYGTNNLFAYVGNNPVIDTDIEGLYDWGTHKNKTKEWGKEIGICNINSIAGANADVDILHPSIGSNRGEWHFPSSSMVQQGI